MRLIARLLDILSTKFVRISGQSMHPALSDGAWVRVNRRAYRDATPARFDVVRLDDPSRAGRWIVKRVVGLPGEEVKLEDGVLFVNGSEIREPHLSIRAPAGKYEWWLRGDEFVVLGDNRSASTDSRRFGPVSFSAIRGKVSL